MKLLPVLLSFLLMSQAPILHTKVCLQVMGSLVTYVKKVVEVFSGSRGSCTSSDVTNITITVGGHSCIVGNVVPSLFLTLSITKAAVRWLLCNFSFYFLSEDYTLHFSLHGK